MNKETTIDDWFRFVKKEVCYKCKYFNKAYGVCGGELLPIERAIMRNLEGRGNCKDIKEFSAQLKGQKKTCFDCKNHFMSDCYLECYKHERINNDSICDDFE